MHCCVSLLRPLVKHGFTEFHVFLNSAARAWFLEIALVHTSVCVSTPKAINNQWCDIDRVRLVKQVLRLFPAFNYFIRQLPSIKWMGVAILTQLVVNTCQRKLR